MSKKPKMMNPSVCSLCQNPLPLRPILDNETAFCCAGCHVVFSILSAKKELQNYEGHPLFLSALQSGLISNRDLLEQFQNKRVNIPEGEWQKVHLEILEMWCPSCAELIRLLLLQQEGIRQCVVDYATDLASIEYSPRHICKEKIFALISNLGYRPCSLQDREGKQIGKDLYFRFIIASFCSLNVMMLAYPLYATYFDYDVEGYASTFAWISLFLSLPVVSYCSWPILRRFFNGLAFGLLSMETLVMMGVIAAFGLSLAELLRGGTRVYFDSMTAIITFVLLGKMIETKAKFSAKETLFHLVHSLPKRGRKLFGEESRFVPLKDIEQGDLLEAFSGEKIVLDGLIIKGEGLCDESLLTGEMMPVRKSVKDQVLAGSIVQQGPLIFKVVRNLQESALNKIITLIEKEIGYKSNYVRAADKVVGWFVPFVIFIALLTVFVCVLLQISESERTVVDTAFRRAISILLISCPCAIGIAAPLAESYLIQGLANLGAIVRNRGCLALLGKETTFVFDKTGTITEGCYTVLSGLKKLTSSQKGILKGLASQSTHPISYAIAKAIEERPVILRNVEEIAGKGLKGEYQGHTYLLGSPKFLEELGCKLFNEEEKFVEQIKSEVFFAQDQAYLAKICLGDRLRPMASALIQSLAIKTVLLSGDSETSTEAVAMACGFTTWKGTCHPLAKKEYIDKLRSQKEIVGMLGDGINDAPALTTAHVGMSVVSATDISIQVSDILLTTDNLSVILKIRALAKKGRRIIHQNLFWAFAYNAVGIALAAFGLLSPLFAAFAMMISSVMVLFNAMRLNRTLDFKKS